MSRINVSIFFCLLVVPIWLHAQIVVPKLPERKSPLQWNHDPYVRILAPTEDRFFPSSIEFYDSTTEKLIKRIELAELNPYGKLDANRIQDYGNDSHSVPISGPSYAVSVQDTVLNGFELFSKRFRARLDEFRSLQPDNKTLSLRCNTGVEIKGNYVVVQYEFLTQWGELSEYTKGICSEHTSLFFFDRKGNLVKKILHMDTGVNDYELYNLEYMVFEVGKDYLGGPACAPRGYVVFDLKNNIEISRTNVTDFTGYQRFSV